MISRRIALSTMIAVAGVSLVGGSTHAVTITSDPADAIVNAERSSDSVSETVVRGNLLTVGGNIQSIFNLSSDQASVIPFALPDQLVTEAEFSITTRPDSRRSAPDYDADLYGLSRTSDDPTVLGSDYYEGPDDPDAIKLADDFVTGTPAANTTFSTSGLDLVSFINTQILADDGDFMFLRLSPEVDPTENEAYIFHSAESTSGARPTLSYTVVPTPSTLGIVSASMVLLAARRRRRA